MRREFAEPATVPRQVLDALRKVAKAAAEVADKNSATASTGLQVALVNLDFALDEWDAARKANA